MKSIFIYELSKCIIEINIFVQYSNLKIEFEYAILCTERKLKTKIKIKNEKEKAIGREVKKMKTYYIIFREEKTGDTPYDAHCGTFETLDEARSEREDIIRYLTRRELDACTITIGKVEVPDDMDADAILEYALESGYYEV